MSDILDEPEEESKPLGRLESLFKFEEGVEDYSTRSCMIPLVGIFILILCLAKTCVFT